MTASNEGHQLQLEARTTALVLMGFQRGVLEHTTGVETLLARIEALVRSARAAGVQVAHVRVAFTDQDYAAIPTYSKTFSGVVAGRLLQDGTPATELAPQTAAEGDIVVARTRFSGFSRTALERLLRAHGIDTLILAGIGTGGVVLATLFEAADRDFRTLVLSDCCVDTSQNVHDLLMQQVFPRQADVVESTEVESAWSRTTKP
jgi:nicotinamidase-related amidase